jgi:hypothetical protein
MRKLTLGIAAAAALVAASAMPAMAQVGFYAGPGGAGVGIGPFGVGVGAPYYGYNTYPYGGYYAAPTYGWGGPAYYDRW